MSDIHTTEENTINPGNESVSERKKKNKFAVKEEITEENCKFTEGQILKFVRVRFPGHARSYSFLIGKRNLTYGKKVVAMSDRGMAVGYINSFPYEIPYTKDLLPLRSINKAATEEDISKEIENYKKQKEIETTCQNLIEKHNLDMNLTHVEFTQFGKKVVFYFVAPARVDFRGLVKDLVGELKLRIELRQISVRDRAASQGAIGPCGRELCCSSFLSKYGNVAIKMAKNQNLTLNYSKLNGVCGQLKCCLQYEDDVYTKKRKRLPQEGDLILTKNGDSGKVRKLNILSQQFDMLTDKGKIKRYSYQLFDKVYDKNDYQFPRHFDNISDETANIVGLNEETQKIERQYNRDLERAKKRAKRRALEVIESISEYIPERDRTQDYADLEKEELELKREIETKEQAERSINKNNESNHSETDRKEDSTKQHSKGQDRSDHSNSNRNKPRRNHRYSKNKNSERKNRGQKNSQRGPRNTKKE